MATALCMALTETLNKIGPAFIETSESCFLPPLSWTLMIFTEVNEVCTLASTILEQKAVCQQDPDQDEAEEAPEETAEYDTMLIASAGDLVAALSVALGTSFTPLFQTFYPLIAKYYVSPPTCRTHQQTAHHPLL